MNSKEEIKVFRPEGIDNKDPSYSGYDCETIGRVRLDLHEVASFERLLAQYKARVLEGYVQLFR